MAKSIEELIGFETLTAAIQDPAQGLPTTALPQGLFTLTTPVAGATSSFLKSTTTRRTSTVTSYGAASRPSQMTDTVRVPVSLIHTLEHQRHGANILAQLKSGDTGRQRLAASEIGAQQANFKRRFDNLRTASVYSMLALGNIYIDSSGNLLPSSASAAITVSYSVPSAHLDNTIIGAWDTTSTNIAAQILDVKETVEKLTGLTPMHCLYGKNVLNYLALNDSLKNLVNANPFATSFLQNEIPNGLLGLNWWPSNRMWFQDQNGTNQDFFGDDSIALIPDPSPDWYELQEGSYAVPTSIGGVSSDAVGALGDFAEVNGQFSYATVTSDPPGIKQVVGDTFLPVTKVGGALYSVSDVTTAVGG